MDNNKFIKSIDFDWKGFIMNAFVSGFIASLDEVNSLSRTSLRIKIVFFFKTHN